MLLFLLACAEQPDPSTLAAPQPKGWESELPPETDLVPQWEGEWPLADGSVLVHHGQRIWRQQGETQHPLASEAIEPPAVSQDGSVVLFGHRDDGLVTTSLMVARAETGFEPELLTSSGTPDRFALHPDGARYAFAAASPQGIVSVWCAILGDAPVQLTNVDLQRIPGQAPEGFVPAPHDGPLRFEGDTLHWRSAEGAHSVACPL